MFKFLDLISNIINESENLKLNNLNQNELKEVLNSFYNINKEYKDKEELKYRKIIDIDLTNKLINEFESFFDELKKALRNSYEEIEKLKKELDDIPLHDEKNKKSLNKELKSNIINEKDNNKDKLNIDKNNSKNKITLRIDTEGELSFKGEPFKFCNNLQTNEEDNIKYNPTLLDNNETGSFQNINSNLNKLNNNNSKSSSDKIIINNNNNELNDENNIIINAKKKELNQNLDNYNTKDFLDINEELLKYQNNLQSRIKSLEEEVEIQKNKTFNFFIEIKNELCDFNEEKISLSKYVNLMELYEKEQERNKILEKKYISSIEAINNNLLNYYKKMNCEFAIDSSNQNKVENKEKDKIYDIYENEIKKSDLNKGNNLHFDYSNMFKAKSILKMNEDIYDNKNHNKELKMKNLIQENYSLKKNEKLLLEQLNTIKGEIKELNAKLEEKDERIKWLNQSLERQNLLQKDKLYIPLRNGLELLITEIKLTNKIKEILRVLLNISLYNNEEIEKIFKYKEKKKNIIGIFKF